MLLVTITNILIRLNTLTVLLEYTNLFQSQSQWQYEGDVGRSYLSLIGPYMALYLSLAAK